MHQKNLQLLNKYATSLSLNIKSCHRIPRLRGIEDMKMTYKIDYEATKTRSALIILSLILLAGQFVNAHVFVPYTACGKVISGGAGTFCQVTPEAYYSTLYKIAVCTSDPMASSTLDLSTCSEVWENSAGVEVNPVALMSGSETLAGTVNRPPDGTYGYMVAVVDPTLEAKFSITIEGSAGTDGTYYSTATPYRLAPLMTTNAADYAKSTDLINNFSDNSQTCDPQLDVDVGEGGAMSAYLVDDAYQITSTTKRTDYEEGGGDQSQYPFYDITCDGVTKIVSVQKMLNGGITISHKTASLNLALKVTGSAGLALDQDGDGDPDHSFPGPWMGVLSTTEVQ